MPEEDNNGATESTVEQENSNRPVWKSLLLLNYTENFEAK